MPNTTCTSHKTMPTTSQYHHGKNTDDKNEDWQRKRIRAFEEKMTTDFATFQDRIRKSPPRETLSRPSSLIRALLILPMPWVCLHTVRQLHVNTQNSMRDSSRNYYDDNFLLCCVKYIAAFVSGFFLADFVSGLGHMRLDTVRLVIETRVPNVQNTDDNNPQLTFYQVYRAALEFAAWGFQRHHIMCNNWSHDDLLESGILTTGALTLPFYFTYLLLVQAEWITSPFVAFGWTAFITTAMHVQVFHALAHNTWNTSATKKKDDGLVQKKMSNLDYDYYYDSFLWFQHNLIQWLRRLHLILDLPSHHLHHTRFDCNFALINGWSNGLLNRLYAYLERNGYIDEDYHGEVQRQLYIVQKSIHVEPYLTMFPEYREHLRLQQPQQQPT